MPDSASTAIPEAAKATSTAHPPVQDRNVAAEMESDRSSIVGDRMMRAIGGGSPEAPPERVAGALGQMSVAAQVGMMRQLQRSYGNSYVGRVIHAKLTVGQPGDQYEQEADHVTRQVLSTPDAGGGRTTSHKLSVIAKQPADAEKPSAPPVKAKAQPLLPTGERREQDTVAEVSTEPATLQSPVPRERAPVNPEDDAGYQAVVRQLKTKAKQEKTPLKTPGKKQQEAISAANLTTQEIGKQDAYKSHLSDLEKVQPHELTEDQFTKQFKDTTNELAQSLPKTQEQHNSVPEIIKRESASAMAKLSVANQTKTQIEPLRTTATKNAAEYQDNRNQEVQAHKLAIDPVGNAQSVDHAHTAAPKPKAKEEISLDDKSRSLDEALQNHNVNGQTINIEESSLALPVSGEPTFDEAGEAKRKAQDEISKSAPRYREGERNVLGKSQSDMQSVVNSGLQLHHASREKSFGEVLQAQETHKGSLEGKKRAVFSDIERAYNDTKNKVDRELEKLQGIEEIFTKILDDAQNFFEKLVRNDLEYIYTPGFFDYSDWKGKHENDIEEEYEKQKRLNGDSRRSSFGSLPGVDPAYFEALKIVQDRSAETLFSDARTVFIGDVNRQVEEKIAKPVVAALNAARKHIQEGKRKAEEAFATLDPKEQEEARNVLGAVTGKFEQLDESIEDRQREIIADMARTYNQSVGKLDARFEEIKKDVLTSWFEKAWNKLKAVVNAIIEFASRLVELLGRLASLVGEIISSPRAFFNNLVNGIGQGFSTFIDRIGEFLATEFFDWLRGSSGLPIQMPKDWGPKGIFSLFTQLLSLGVETIWERMEVVYDKTIANAFRRGEVLLDRGLEIFGIIKNEGLAGLWDEIKNSLGNILEETLDMIKENVLYAAIKKAIFEIGKMLVPGGGFIAIAEKVIRLVQFLAEARNKILDLIEAFVDSVEMAVKGNVPGIVKHITSALTKFITIALDFLVSFFGLGSLKEKVTRFIQRMRQPIIHGIDWVLNKFKPIVMKGKKLFEKGKAAIEKAKKKVKATALALLSWWKISKTFSAADGETHKLFFKGIESSAVLTVKSIERTFTDFVNSAKPGTDNKKITAKKEAQRIAGLIDAERTKPIKGETPEEKDQARAERTTKVNELLEELKTHTSILFGSTMIDSASPKFGSLNEAGFGTSMSVKGLTNKERPQGSPPTSAGNDKYANLNERKNSAGSTASYYIKGHLLNQSLGGIGDWENLTPLSRSGNAKHEVQAESTVKRTVDLPAIVQYAVKPNYSKRSDKSSLKKDINNSLDSTDAKQLKLAIVEAEDFVPTSLTIKAYILDESLKQKKAILDQSVDTPIERDYENYYLSSTLKPNPVNLSEDKAAIIATLPGIGSILADRIVEARRKRLKNFDRPFTSYSQLSELVPGIGEERMKALEKAGHVKLY